MKKWLLLPAALLVMGCSAATKPAPPATVTTPAADAAKCDPGNDASVYFPYKMGLEATYKGTGDPSANYKVTVLGVEQGKVEWRLNSGHVDADVFQVTPDQIMWIYHENDAFEAESRMQALANMSEVILQTPLKVGHSWKSQETTYTIKSVSESLTALNQTLNCVVAVDAQGPNQKETVTYFAKDYGIVLTVYNPNGPNKIVSGITEYRP